jgi:hypothetical protein
MTKVKSLLVMSLLLLLCPALALAQTTSSTSAVSGVVTDPTGAVIPGVTVTLTDTKTSKEQTTTTDDQGVYRFNQVPPGAGYTLTFTNTGFQTLKIENVKLGVGTSETHNVQLTIGQVGEQVTVTSGGEATLNTTDASIGNVIDERRLRELPIQVRSSPAALVGLQPGVVGSSLGTTSANRVGSITGARADQGNITVDGIDANDQATGQFAATTGNSPIDSLQEFRAVTTNPNAAEGRSSGGQIQLLTKSGTNEFSGNLRWYNRTAATAANTFFNNALGVFGPNDAQVTQGLAVAGQERAARPKLTRNQFGGSLGGPVVRDKLFFFFDYEGRREVRGIPYLRIVPLPSFRAGNVAYINNTAGCGTNSRQNTTPNCISFLTPAQVAALDPRGVGVNQALLSFINSRYPLPNDLTAGDGINTAGFRFNAPASRVENTTTTRIDWNINDKQKLFGRLTIGRSQNTDTVNTVAQMFPSDPESPLIIQRDYTWVVGHTWTLTPNIVNQATVGVARSGLIFQDPRSDAFPNVYGAPGAADPGGTFAAGLSPPFGRIDLQERFVPVPTIRDDLTWNKGNHTLAFGASIKPWKFQSSNTNDFNFVTLGLGNLGQLDASLRPGNLRAGTTASGNFDAAFAFLLGRIDNVNTNFNYDANGTPLSLATGKTRNYSYSEYEFYGQDNWRVSSSLTLTAGLRWQYYTVPFETNGFQSCGNVEFQSLWDIRVRNAASGVATNTSEPLTTYDLCGKKNNRRAMYQPDLNNFAPRVSFAWNPSFKDGLMGKLFGDRKTVIRGGGAVTYDHIATTLTFIQDQVSYLFDSSPVVQFGAGGPRAALLNDPRFTGINTLPTQAQNTPPVLTRPLTPYVENGVPVGSAQGQLNYSIDPNFKIPYSIQYSFGFQRELPGNFILGVDYVGRQGRQLFMEADAAQTLNFRDPASGQFLLDALNAVQSQLAAGVAAGAVTNQPFLENQMNAAAVANYGGTCAQVFGLSCTRVVSSFFGTSTLRGDTSTILFLLANNALLNPNVGISGQFLANLYITNLGSSSYNGMLLSLRKRFSQGLQFDFNYTLSHSIDNQSSIVNTVLGGIVCDLRNLRVCRGDSDFDIRHNVNANFIYELPFGRGRMFGTDAGGLLNNIIGGWTVSGIFNARSGLTFNTSSSALPISAGQVSPALLNGDGSALSGQINTTSSGTIQFFGDRTAALGALTFPQHGQIGNRNILKGPGFWNVDLAVLKNFQMPWSERQRLQLRWEMYNAFNHNNFGLPNATITSANFGVISASANNPREMQFAIRYEF